MVSDRVVLLLANGFNLMGDEVLGITYTPNDYDLPRVYQMEHFEVINPLHDYLVPFSPDGGGNFYCFDTRKFFKRENSCKIVFWQSNYPYSINDIPEVTHNSFVDYCMDCIIGWTLEEYNYQGERL